MRFKNQVVWITGGGSGIGKALAEQFAAQGAKIAVSGRRLDRLTQIAESLRSQGHDAIAVTCDVSDEQSVKQAVEQVVREFGGIDVAIANAGFSVSGRVENLSMQDWQRQFATNTFGAAMTIKYAMPHLRKTKGRMVLVGSVASMIPTPGVGAYVASKYALRGLGQTLAMEMYGTGVSVTLIYPGFVESEIAQVDNLGRFDASRPDKRPANLMWTSERAAKVMADAIYKRKREYVFTAHGTLGAILGKHAPGVVHWMLTKGGVARKGYLNE